MDYIGGELLVEDVDVDVEQAWTGWVELLEGAPAQVDDAARDVRPAVSDSGDDRATGVGRTRSSN